MTFPSKVLLIGLIAAASACLTLNCKVARAAEFDGEPDNSDMHSRIQESKDLEHKGGKSVQAAAGKSSGSGTGGSDWSSWGRHYNGTQFDEKDYPLSIRPLIVQAEDFRQKHDEVQALRCYAEAVKIAPDCLPLRTRRAATLMRQKDYKAAMDDLSYALKKDPKLIRAYSIRSRCFEQLGDNQNALADLNTVVSLSPDHGPALMRRATLYETMGRKKEAAVDKAKAVHLIALRKVNGYVSTGRFADALSVVREGLKLEPEDKELQNQVAVLLCSMRKYKDAIAYLDKRTSENSAEVYFLRGKAYDGEGEFDKAISDYTKAISIAGPPPKKDSATANGAKGKTIANYYFERAHSHWKLKQYARVISDCSSYLTSSPDADAYSLRADAYAMSGSLKNAVADYQAATKINPKLEHALLEGARMADRLWLQPEAIAFYTQLIALHPKITDFYMARAHQYEKANKLSEAEKDLDICVELEPYDGLGFASRGLVRASLHKYQQAINDYTTALKFEPDSPTLLAKRAEAYEHTGNKELAAADKKAALEKKLAK